MKFTLVLDETINLIPDGWTFSENCQILKPENSSLQLKNGQDYDVVSTRIARVLHYRVVVPYEGLDPFGAPKVKKEHFLITQEEAESLFPGLRNGKTYRAFTVNHHVLHDLISKQEERLKVLQKEVEALVPKDVHVTYDVLAGHITLIAEGYHAHFEPVDYPREKDFYGAITKEVDSWSL